MAGLGDRSSQSTGASPTPAIYPLPFTKVMEGLWGDGDPETKTPSVVSRSSQPRGKTAKQTERRKGHSKDLNVCGSIWRVRVRMKGEK